MGNRRRAKWAFLLLFIPWLLSGGCVVHEYKYCFVDSYDNDRRPYLGVTVASNYRTVGVPLLFTHTQNRPPHDLEFYYATKDIVEGAELLIDRIAVRYSDGTEVDLTGRVDKRVPLHRDEMWYIENHKLVKTPSMQETWVIRDGITREGGFRVLVSCSLRRGGRVLERIDASLGCSPWGQTECFTTWWWWIVSNA